MMVFQGRLVVVEDGQLVLGPNEEVVCESASVAPHAADVSGEAMYVSGTTYGIGCSRCMWIAKYWPMVWQTLIWEPSQSWSIEKTKRPS